MYRIPSHFKGSQLCLPLAFEVMFTFEIRYRQDEQALQIRLRLGFQASGRVEF